MEIASFETFEVHLDFGAEPDSRMKHSDPPAPWDFADAQGLVFLAAWGKFRLSWGEAGGLISALTWARNQHDRGAQLEADGTVAAVLLQNHLADAPGDFG
jgi:hypothetical protein